VSVFDCRPNVRGECACFQSLLILLILFKTIIILKQDLLVLTTGSYCRHGINWMFVPNCLATDSSLLPATSQDIRFGKKFIFSAKMEIIDGCEGLNSGHGSSMQNSSHSLCFFIYTYKWADSGHNVWSDNITFLPANKWVNEWIITTYIT